MKSNHLSKVQYLRLWCWFCLSCNNLILQLIPNSKLWDFHKSSQQYFYIKETPVVTLVFKKNQQMTFSLCPLWTHLGIMSTVLKPSIFSALLQRLRDGKALILLWVCILSLVYQCWNHLLQDIRLGLLFSWNSGKFALGNDWCFSQDMKIWLLHSQNY